MNNVFIDSIVTKTHHQGINCTYTEGNHWVMNWVLGDPFAVSAKPSVLDYSDFFSSAKCVGGRRKTPEDKKTVSDCT